VRIIGINGVWCDRNPVWNNLEAAFRSRFHVSDFVIEEEMNCHPWQVARLRRFADRILERYDDGDETLLIGHSMGDCEPVSEIASTRRRLDIRAAPLSRWGLCPIVESAPRNARTSHHL
jgi:hypothetical protein